ncbi:MAG: T9SS type A sorting domain-containing protein [Bacteroidia bacterium]
MHTVKELADGSLLFLGENYDNGSFLAVAFKTDKNGRVIWQRNYRYFDDFRVNNFLQNIAPTPFGGIILVGDIVSRGTVPGFDTTGLWSWIMLTDSFGCVQPDCQDTTVKVGIKEVERQIALHIYPNPATDEVIIALPEAAALKDVSLIVYNSLGQLVYRQRSAGAQSIINVGTWKPGLYLVEARTGDTFSSYKLMVE